MDAAGFYRENGYYHARGVFDAGEVEEMRAAIEQILADVEGTANDENHRWNTAEKETVLKGFHNVQYHAAAFTRAVAHPGIVAVLTQLIGPNVQLHHTKMLVKPPEKGAPFPMHQDHPYFPHERHTMLAASVHLDDTDEENGCLHVVPASHLRGPLEPTGESKSLDVPLEEGIPVPCAAGDVLFFNYLTIHGSGVNRSARVRRNVLFQYRDPEDRPLTKDGVEEHVNWGQGLMVAGRNPVYWQTRPRFTVLAAA
ncbi:MAG TPA: phytanoyl-CoA dioxygenase family protein [Gaiellaceae bacterium]|nr:phytanoyl-CoA dioxygenase family protein [Gaiellaceae bacterium]